MNKYLTIITPTFNRSNYLIKCYESLIEQTDDDFEWLIIDDGSEDNTKAIVNQFIDEKKITIRYMYKENGGKHTALNLGFKEAKGKLSMILDSDDLLVNNAVSRIKTLWIENEKIPNLSSLVFLRKYPNGKIIGEKFPTNMKVSNHIDIAINNRVHGDKCEVYLTEILKQYQYPTFPNEKFLSESIVWIQIGRKYDLLCINEAIYITDYLENGLTKSGRKLRIKCPFGGMAVTYELIDSDIKYTQLIKNTILYIIYGLFSNIGLINIIKNSKKKGYTFICFPFSVLIFFYWKFKYKD